MAIQGLAKRADGLLGSGRGGRGGGRQLAERVARLSLEYDSSSALAETQKIPGAPSRMPQKMAVANQPRSMFACKSTPFALILRRRRRCARRGGVDAVSKSSFSLAPPSAFSSRRVTGMPTTCSASASIFGAPITETARRSRVRRAGREFSFAPP